MLAACCTEPQRRAARSGANPAHDERLEPVPSVYEKGCARHTGIESQTIALAKTNNADRRGATSPHARARTLPGQPHVSLAGRPAGGRNTIFRDYSVATAAGTDPTAVGPVHPAGKYLGKRQNKNRRHNADGSRISSTGAENVKIPRKLGIIGSVSGSYPTKYRKAQNR